MKRKFTVEQEEFVACFLPGDREDVIYQLRHHFNETKNSLYEMARGTAIVLESMTELEFELYIFEKEV